MTKTALEIGLESADVVTTVNRGFAWGLQHEPIQTQVMAQHLQPLLDRVVGIDNAAFSSPSPFSMEFSERFKSDPQKGTKLLVSGQAELRARLPEEIRSKLGDKVLVVAMGRRVSQKMHEVLVKSASQLLKQDPDFPLFIFFATKRGDASSAARLNHIQKFQRAFPQNVAWSDGALDYYGLLMQAADYNCMPSLYEPHGAAFSNTLVPIARAVDGLAEQICAFEPAGEAAGMNALWHARHEAPTGFLFREMFTPDEEQLVANLRELLGGNISSRNRLFNAMSASLTETLRQAVELRTQKPEKYAELVLAAIEKQLNTSWDSNLKSLLKLIKQARLKRPL
jgi:glycogen synthase